MKKVKISIDGHGAKIMYMKSSVEAKLRRSNYFLAKLLPFLPLADILIGFEDPYPLIKPGELSSP